MISIEESARPAATTDLDVIGALLDHAVAELKPRRGGSIFTRREARARPAHDALHRALTDDDQLIVVGTIDEVVVGFSGVRRERLLDGVSLAVIEDIYVLPEAREVGVGEAMLDLCLQWAEESGCIGLDALALPGDRHTKNFFESFGLVARAIIVHRDLRGDDA